jgi:hypothetical protein
MKATEKAAFMRATGAVLPFKMRFDSPEYGWESPCGNYAYGTDHDGGHWSLVPKEVFARDAKYIGAAKARAETAYLAAKYDVLAEIFDIKKLAAKLGGGE